MPGLYLYFRAFFDLDRERPTGFSNGYIPRRSIADYAEQYEFDEVQTESLHHHIRAMDSAMMKIDRQKAEQKAASAPRRLIGKRR